MFLKNTVNKNGHIIFKTVLDDIFLYY